MWLVTTEGFYSVIRWHDGRMCVRARQRADLDRLRKIAPELSAIEVTPGRDYRYRCFCTQKQWVKVAGRLAEQIDYGNFKSEVARKRGMGGYEKALHSVWSIFGKLQPAGPYGYGSRKGYPAVPKKEAKAVKDAEKTRPAWTAGSGLGRSFAETPHETWSTQTRLFGPEDTGLVCKDCGTELDGREAIEIDGDVLCRDVGKCVGRMNLKT